MIKSQNEHDILYKVVLVGDSGVGKTNIMTRFVKSQFLVESKTTIGVQFSSKLMQIQGKKAKVQVWDTAGQERYRSIVSSYYRGAAASILVYDISRNSSFQSIQKWLKEIKNYGDQNMVTMLIGNKTDLKHLRSVRTENAEQYARNNQMLFIQTSALDSSNIDQAFQILINQVYKRQQARQALQTVKKAPVTVIKKQNIKQIEKKKKCC